LARQLQRADRSSNEIPRPVARDSGFHGEESSGVWGQQPVAEIIPARGDAATPTGTRKSEHDLNPERRSPYEIRPRGHRQWRAPLVIAHLVVITWRI
jgi:hypothetical protein